MPPDSTATRFGGLGRTTVALIVVTSIVGVCHHVDHVLRVDHSGWPFRADVNPFTFSLLAYPILAFTLFGPARLFWLRWAALVVGAGFTIFAHSMIESPQMQFAMWAHDRSLEARYAGLHNMLHAASPAMGTVAVAISMTLNVLLVVTAVSMLADGLRRRTAF